jgi:hypothetical protein
MSQGFVCNDCGIGHKHNEGLDHSLTGAFSIVAIASIASEMDYNKECHCGWHEFNSMIQDGEINVDTEVAEFVSYRCKDLLIPTDVENELYK